METDYLQPTIYHQSDYRTSSYRAHHFKLSPDRNFIPSNAHILCNELKRSQANYQPRSETVKEFQWKINPSRNFREEFAAPIERVRYIHQYTDKIKANALVKSLKLYKSKAGDCEAFPNLPRSVKQSIPVEPPRIDHLWRETFPTGSAGYYPHLDYSVSTTEFDFYKHKNYETARTNLIAQKELPFNSKVAFFIPKTKLIAENPFCGKYDAKHLRDISKFPTHSYDRITFMRTNCRPMRSETSSSF
jgi:hypothetical protein